MSTGSAPIAPEVLKFFRVAFGQHASFVEGYGQTEAIGTAARCMAEDLSEFFVLFLILPCLLAIRLVEANRGRKLIMSDLLVYFSFAYRLPSPSLLRIRWTSRAV